MKRIIAFGLGVSMTIGCLVEAKPVRSIVVKQGVTYHQGYAQMRRKAVTKNASLQAPLALSMPDKKKVSRRRVLFSFGLFGMGIRFGWNKPKQVIARQVDGTAIVKRKGMGSPILTFSVGRREFGLGADNIARDKQATSMASNAAVSASAPGSGMALRQWY